MGGLPLIDIIIACLLGVLCGTITGTIPGIHVNTAGAILFAASTFFLEITSVEALCTFLAAMGIAHALIEFVPSIFLGIPDENTALSILPAHRMVIDGRGKEAIRIVALGGFGAILITIIALPLFIMILPAIYEYIQPYVWIILVLGSIYMIFRLGHGLKNWFYSTLIFLGSGILGWTMLQTPISSNLSLMCLFTGLFGISTMLFSLNESSIIPIQDPNINFRLSTPILKGMLAGGLTGVILGFLPGFGPAQGSIIAQELTGAGHEENTESFLTAMSGVNSSDTLFSLVAFYLIGNPRSGIAVYITQFLQEFSIYHLLFFVFVSLTSVSISMIICIKLGDIFSDFIQKINYKRLTKIIIIFMAILLLVFSVIENAPLYYILLALMTSISLGLVPHYLGVSKSHLMGVLIVPAIIVYCAMFL